MANYTFLLINDNIANINYKEQYNITLILHLFLTL